MRQYFAFFVFISLQLIGLGQLEGGLPDLDIRAESVILINPDTGTVLYEKNAHDRRFPASITKVATALYTLHVYGDKLETSVTAEHDSVASVSKEAKKRSGYTLPAHWLEPDATHIGIKKDEVLSLNDLLNGMLIASGNDASNVIAQYIGGTVPRFMKSMNAYLKTIGCKNTEFCNPHGLHHPDHCTTAYDMALIAKEAMKYPVFRDIVKTVHYTRPKTNKQPPTTLIQTNRLLRKGPLYYSNAVGIKTGWTSDAKHTLVTAAEYKGRRLIAVLIQVKEREELFKSAKKLFDAAFSQTRLQRVLLKAGPQKHILEFPGAAKRIETYLEKDVCVDFFPAEEPELVCKLFWDKFALPIKKDQKLGELLISDIHGKKIHSAPLYALNDVEKKWYYRIPGFFDNSPKEEKKFEKPLERNYFYKTMILVAGFFLLTVVLMKMRK